MDNFAITFPTAEWSPLSRSVEWDPSGSPEGIAGPGFLSGNVQGVNVSLQGVVDKPETPLVQVFHTHVPFLRA